MTTEKEDTARGLSVVCGHLKVEIKESNRFSKWQEKAEDLALWVDHFEGKEIATCIVRGPRGYALYREGGVT